MAAPVNTKLFAGDEWEVRAKGNGGPGSNLWDDTHAHVDDNGWLHLKRTTCNFSHFVACTIWRGRGVSPRHSRAHRLQRRAPLRGLLVSMDLTFDLRHSVRNCAGLFLNPYEFRVAL